MKFDMLAMLDVRIEYDLFDDFLKMLGLTFDASHSVDFCVLSFALL